MDERARARLAERESPDRDVAYQQRKRQRAAWREAINQPEVETG